MQEVAVPPAALRFDRVMTTRNVRSGEVFGCFGGSECFVPRFRHPGRDLRPQATAVSGA